jgi:hypothetical protein
MQALGRCAYGAARFACLTGRPLRGLMGSVASLAYGQGESKRTRDSVAGPVPIRERSDRPDYTTVRFRVVRR